MSKELDDFLALEAELELPEAQVVPDFEITNDLDWLLTIAEMGWTGHLYYRDGTA
jgi:hypothetical protein